MRFLTTSTLVAISLAVATMPTYANNTNQAKLAVVKKFMTNAQNDNLVKLGSRSLKQLFQQDDYFYEQYQELICVEAHPFGQDYSIKSLQTTAQYRVLSNGDISVKAKGYANEPYQTVIFKVNKENGQYKIDDYYKSGWHGTYKEYLAECLAQY